MVLVPARQWFQTLVQKPEAMIDLTAAALAIAQEEYPNLDPAHCHEQLETLAAEVRSRLPATPYPLKVIEAINHVLYTEHQFQGNTDQYYDPRNSFLNDVLDRHLGIPITLALVYLDISQRIDFPMVGIGMPGHFLIRPEFEAVGIFVDAFNRGEILFEQDCEALLSQIYQRPITLQTHFLEPVTAKLFLARMLNNLKHIYLNQSEFTKGIACCDRILLLFPDHPLEHRTRGLLHYELQHWPAARHDLQQYLHLTPNAQDTLMIQRLLLELTTR
ncbi:SirB1 family protein [Spirulina major]|uniref:SirB1 family protein n=1 Tax=Spirulina major TaxID=270636 RepID=UPI000934A52C|nr:tetratricopeptide repeat protein [Spirulina major]